MQNQQIQTEPTQVLITIHLARHWSIFHRRNLIMALADALPAGWAILAVNRPLTVEVTPLKYPGRLRRELFHRRPQKISPRLYLYTPVLPLHEQTAQHIPGATQLNIWLLRRQLRGLMDEWFPDARSIISWIYHPFQHWLWRLLPEAKTVYECYDEYGFWPDGTPRRDIQQIEKQLLAESGLTFVTADLLGRQRAGDTPRACFLPNGVPASLVGLQDAQTRSRPAVSGVRVGYLGNWYSFMATELLYTLGRNHPEWSFHFAGPVTTSRMTAKIRKLPNVVFQGPIPYTEVPAFLAGLDVALIPFVLNDYVRATNPLKTYEYMAAGVPIVASDLPELRRFAHVIRIVENTPEAFAAAITAILDDDREILRKKMVATVREYTWEAISRRVILPELQRLVGEESKASTYDNAGKP